MYKDQNTIENNTLHVTEYMYIAPLLFAVQFSHACTFAGPGQVDFLAGHVQYFPSGRGSS